MNTCFRRWLTALMLALSALAVPIVLSGCNTMEGAGEDIQEGGEAVQDAAD